GPAAAPLRRPRRNPRGGRQALRPLPRRILAQAGHGARLPHRVRPGADGGRLPRRPDPGGVRRRRPAAFGRRRDPGGDPPRWLQRRRVPRPDVHHGHHPQARQPGPEAPLPAQDRHRRAALAGLRRHGAHQRQRHHHAPHLRQARGRQVRRQRPEDLDQPRGALRPDAAARAHHAARADQEAHGRALDAHRGHEGGARKRPDHPPDPHHDEPQFLRDLLRQRGGSGGEPGRRGGPRLPLHPGRHERRAAADLGRVRRRRQVVHQQGGGLRQGARAVQPPDRAEPGRPVPDRPRLRPDARRRGAAAPGLREVRGRDALRRGGEHGQDALRRRLLGRGGGLHPDPRRLRLRRGVRRGAEVPRSAALPSGADQHQPRAELRGRARARHAAELL
ncbi:MAG: Acyl-CoA dehydrogenase, partial [uncultured Acetobacteraceae bacterium]